MKVISLMEPWASLIKERKKLIETRSWKTNYRGELYIHASIKKITKKNLAQYKEQLNLLEESNFQYGYIIAKCRLIDCIYMDESFIKITKMNRQEYICGGYSVGRYAWILDNIKPLKKPISAKGQLGIWEYKNNKN